VTDATGLAIRKAISRELVAGGVLEPVDPDLAERRRWAAFDLASMVEGSLHVALDPRALPMEEAEGWAARLGDAYGLPAVVGDVGADRHWLLERGERVGTIQLEVEPYGSTWQSLSSLYVHPAARGAGTATRALQALAATAARHDLRGLRLSTEWTWQKSVGFYLARGFWLHLWKHDLQLVLSPRLPRWSLQVNGDEAVFGVGVDTGFAPLFTALRRGDRLELLRAPGEAETPEVERYAIGTLALLLAHRGWPLVRDEVHWRKRYDWSDVGEPEGLASKIGIFEQVARRRGFVVETPRVPGLEMWRIWARGEECGRQSQLLCDLEAALARFGLELGPERRTRLARLDPWRLEHLFRRALETSSAADWEREAATVVGAT